MKSTLVLPDARIILNYSHLLLPSELSANKRQFCDASRLVDKNMLPEYVGTAARKIAWLPEYAYASSFVIVALCTIGCDGCTPDLTQRLEKMSGLEVDCYFGMHAISVAKEIELSAPVEMKSFRLMNYEKSALVDLPGLKFGYDFSNSVLLRLVEDQIGLEEFLQASFVDSLHGFFGEIVNEGRMLKAS